MQKNTVTIGKNKSLSAAAQLMYKKHVGCLVVTKPVAGRQTPEGVITDRDIALAINLSPEPQEALVSSVMVSHPVTAKKNRKSFYS